MQNSILKVVSSLDNVLDHGIVNLEVEIKISLSSFDFLFFVKIGMDDLDGVRMTLQYLTSIDLRLWCTI